MGLKPPDIPDDFGWGNDCIACWPAGKTPNYLFLRFWDIDACLGNPDPPNGYPFLCAQVPGSPCSFKGTVELGSFSFVATYASNLSTIQLLTDEVVPKNYFWAVGDPCNAVFDTNLNTCPIFAGENGRCIVTIYIDHIIIMLVSHYHFVTVPRVFYERFPCGIDHWCYRLASHHDSTNVLFLIDDEDVEVDYSEH